MKGSLRPLSEQFGDTAGKTVGQEAVSNATILVPHPDDDGFFIPKGKFDFTQQREDTNENAAAISQRHHGHFYEHTCTILIQLSEKKRMISMNFIHNTARDNSHITTVRSYSYVYLVNH
jgi:hypothetical protein